ncbi:hypothetical protein HanRHA438_Chr09g0394691 [Helianthus annuus]|nr:hypothetical protein HanHA300_Chr09g0314391 [Helianthus annuus]KAJ0542023.1 hypothetical protein HanHA89_Chr09g0335251 [Helianthus annuus]KAJ0707088.1 hypothetical protein HanLR1_Chr09g0314601 [Helianthus annuus]KAJ0711109.1 hypothetical protein HanOQP8_Chr09g0320181 [Helianthus annuus]KAJ0887771.1 hypothetical protein HanRHA438_Chr09g0394691 [Helianthus annuus]
MVPNSSSKLYLPKVTRSSGLQWTCGLRPRAGYKHKLYVKASKKGFGKPKFHISKDICGVSIFRPKKLLIMGLVQEIMRVDLAHLLAARDQELRTLSAKVIVE